MLLSIDHNHLWCRQMPRFKEGNFEKNVELVSKLKDLAEKKNITSAKLALAWVHAQVKSFNASAVIMQKYTSALAF